MEAPVPVVPLSNDGGHGPRKFTVLLTTPEDQLMCGVISG
jgi:hypothetical protein